MVSAFLAPRTLDGMVNIVTLMIATLACGALEGPTPPGTAAHATASQAIL